MASVTLKKTSSWWYGRYKVDGKEYTKNLHVEVRGQRPVNLTEKGSKQFEISRLEAQAELNRLLRDIKSGKSEVELAQAVYQARTGGRNLPSYQISDLITLWKDMPRKKQPSAQYKKQCLATLVRYQKYMADSQGSVRKMDHVSHQHAKGFMDSEEARGITPKTWNDVLKLMKTTFHRAGSSAFDELVTKDVETAFREPYSPDELEAILEASQQDGFIRPIIITAVCTAMRLGDCCQLKWRSVDLSEGFVTVKTSKTGATVDIPLFPMLFDEITARIKNGSDYIFPGQAHQYQKNPGVLTRSLRKVLAVAGFRDEEELTKTLSAADVNNGKVLLAAVKYFKTIENTAKRAAMQKLLPKYLSGNCMGAAANLTGISKASASHYLNEIEEAIDVPFIRGKRRPVDAMEVAPKRGDIRIKRDVGLRRASIRDFHSFRTTWITLALSSGMPFELVTRVTGHTTASVVMKHYFRPQRATLKKALQTHMPKLLTAGAEVSDKERVISLLAEADEHNWQMNIHEALTMLRRDAEQ